MIPPFIEDRLQHGNVTCLLLARSVCLRSDLLQNESTAGANHGGVRKDWGFSTWDELNVAAGSVQNAIVPFGVVHKEAHFEVGLFIDSFFHMKGAHSFSSGEPECSRSVHKAPAKEPLLYRRQDGGQEYSESPLAPP
jgi:hypothetical protein